ncbi:hypothetical protein XENOCAPTIV_019424 [Xenoophorus captivus]|uniref:Uncharacterized protein n=1 Tax=Xenoophorus captivus TaxID=1517983 RepID=A0ABV0RJZ9_9TELE
MGGGGLGLHRSHECTEFITPSTQMVSGCSVSTQLARQERGEDRYCFQVWERRVGLGLGNLTPFFGDADESGWIGRKWFVGIWGNPPSTERNRGQRGGQIWTNPDEVKGLADRESGTVVMSRKIRKCALLSDARSPHPFTQIVAWSDFAAHAASSSAAPSLSLTGNGNG